MKKRPAPPVLNVLWPDGRLVGRVISTGTTYFAYDEQWLTTGHDLSPIAVPYTITAFRQRAAGFDQLPGFLADCLPDQWGRRLMNRAFNERDVTATPMRMLAWVGRRGLGALSFEPAFDEEHSRASWEPASALFLTRQAQAVLREEPPAAFALLQQAGTAGGALPKATVALLPDGNMLLGGDVANASAQHPGARLGLLKLDCDDDTAARTTDGRMEYAYMKMAQAAGIETARTQLLPDSTGNRPRWHLFVERFDCNPALSRRYHLLTLAGALHSFNLSYQNLLVTTRQLTRDHDQVIEATRRMIFNVRSGNADDHGKNHSFLYDDVARRWTLSPAYDLTLNFSDGRNYQGLFPTSFGNSPRLALLAGTAADAGVTLREFEALDSEVTAAITRWPEFAGKAGLERSSQDRASSVHIGLATRLGIESPTPKRTKRPKLW